jgi:uncharacterized membrane protein YedE/YeeE
VKPLLFAACGFLFAVGLALSGMTHPSKVSGFLDFFGAWDPTLAFVMVGAVGVFSAAHLSTRRLSRPLLGERFPKPPPTGVDARLVIGAALFGVGWGMSGFCPGPALVSIGAGARAALWFVPSMVVGMLIYRVLIPRRR